MANALLYGMMQLKDLTRSRVVEVDPDLLISSVGQTLADHDAEVNAILDLFSDETEEPQLRFKGAAITRNQPLDENGRTRPIKPAAPYTVGFPLDMSGNAWGSNFVTNEKMTVQELNDILSQLYYGDFAWLRDKILGTLFDNVGYSFPDELWGSVPVKGLANGDTVTYALSTSGADSLATDTHYIAQANAIDNSNNPFPAIYTELTEHPENSTEVLTFINSAQYAAVSGLTNFVGIPDPDIQPGANVSRLVGGVNANLPARAAVVGKTDKVWIAQWNAIPANYSVSISLGGTPPLKRRVDPEPNLRGFRPKARIQHFPFFDEQWIRRIGFGGWNRVGAVVNRFGNASYAVPTNYTVPMS